MFEFEGQKFYTTKEVAELLHLTHRTVWQKIKDGKLKAKKVGRGYSISDSNIIEFMGGKVKE